MFGSSFGGPVSDYALNVLSIEVPPLREPVEDIPLLVWRFVDEFSTAYGETIDSSNGRFPPPAHASCTFLCPRP